MGTRINKAGLLVSRSPSGCSEWDKNGAFGEGSRSRKIDHTAAVRGKRGEKPRRRAGKICECRRGCSRARRRGPGGFTVNCRGEAADGRSPSGPGYRAGLPRFSERLTGPSGWSPTRAPILISRFTRTRPRTRASLASARGKRGKPGAPAARCLATRARRIDGGPPDAPGIMHARATRRARDAPFARARLFYPRRTIWGPTLPRSAFMPHVQAASRPTHARDAFYLESHAPRAPRRFAARSNAPLYT